MKRAGETFSCPSLFIFWSFNAKSLTLGKNLFKRNYGTDSKCRMENFNAPNLHGFS